jgi:PAS domain S-box-containing protein
MIWAVPLIITGVAIAALITLHRGMRRAQAKLQESNRFLDYLVENLPVMVFIKDARTLKYIRQNRATLALLGLTSNDVIGKNDHDFLPKEQADFVLSKDRELLATGKLVDVPEQSIQSRDLGVRFLHTRKVPILDDSGKPQFLLGISVDVTERKQAEESIRKLNAELEEKAAQLEASNRDLESFSYSVSHDLYAPLRAIDGFAQLLEDDCKEHLPDEGKRFLSVIRENSQRMGKLIDGLLEFSRLGRQSVAPQEVDMASLVQEVHAQVLAELSTSDQARAPRFEINALPPALGDAVLLRQVWANLIGNAVKYSAKIAAPLIKIAGEHAGVEVIYSVQDNGAGFDMRYAERLFGVFQRLHSADEFSGTGVGLAIVHSVVTRHGGRVWAQSAVGQGATFFFALPSPARL